MDAAGLEFQAISSERRDMLTMPPFPTGIQRVRGLQMLLVHCSKKVVLVLQYNVERISQHLCYVCLKTGHIYFICLKNSEDKSKDHSYKKTVHPML